MTLKQSSRVPPEDEIVSFIRDSNCKEGIGKVRSKVLRCLEKNWGQRTWTYVFRVLWFLLEEVIWEG
ncbi:hypothetical protein MRB53_022870 [Persea americana]|uniref:Uncharacterized protein n=1 Tax=Persea americana TaxID=3435 RepID=A0ACC2L7U1_PERAE|nr:hypothetical protein MRB53_022870 [Persea americana]